MLPETILKKKKTNTSSSKARKEPGFKPVSDLRDPYTRINRKA